MPFFKALEKLGDLIALFLSPYFPFFSFAVCLRILSMFHEQKGKFMEQVKEVNELPASGLVRKHELINHKNPDGSISYGILRFGQTTLYEMVKRGEFPKPVPISKRLIAWRVEDVRGWMTKQTAKPYTPTPFIK
jgi:predicted DNA-binding transcriptional regulator AlpA